MRARVFRQHPILEQPGGGCYGKRVVRSNLALRLLTAAVVVPPLLVLLFRGPAWGVFALVFVVALLGAFELFRMTHPGDTISQGIGIAFTAAVSLALYLHPKDPRVLVTILLALPTFGILVPLLRLGDIATAGIRVMAGVAGPLYVGASLTTLALLKSEFDAAEVEVHLKEVGVRRVRSRLGGAGADLRLARGHRWLFLWSFSG